MLACLTDFFQKGDTNNNAEYFDFEYVGFIRQTQLKVYKDKVRVAILRL